MRHRSIALILIVVLIALTLGVSCNRQPNAASAGGKRTPLVIYNWGEYLSDTEDTIEFFGREYEVKDVRKAFEDAYPQYEVKYFTFDDNEKMYPKLATESYDLIVPSDYMAIRLFQENKLQPLDKKRLPTVEKNLDPRLATLNYNADAAVSKKLFDYAVPYLYCTVGLVYDQSAFGEISGNNPAEVWKVLFDPANKDRIGMYNSMRESIGVALNYSGHSLNTLDQAQLDAAKQLLIDQRKQVRPLYGIDDLKDKFVSGELKAGVAWSGDHVVIQQRIAEGGGDPEKIQYLLPRGSNFSVDLLCIPQNAKNPQGAHDFIDFLYRPEIALMNAVYVGYSTPNTAAYAQLPESIAKNVNYYPDDTTMQSLEIYYSSKQIDETYNRIWEAVLAN